MTRYGSPLNLPPDAGYPLLIAGSMLVALGTMAIATRNFRRADPIGRRQMKWILLAAYVAFLPFGVA